VEQDCPEDWPALEFRPLESRRYPAFSLITEAARMAQSNTVAANAADEVAVQAFMEERIAFGDIPKVIEGVLSRHTAGDLPDLDAVETADREARRIAEEEVSSC
jgi:1-deoxy-D-xylulose-5-phosphate reductoisomerase